MTHQRHRLALLSRCFRSAGEGGSASQGLTTVSPSTRGARSSAVSTARRQGLW